MNSIISVLGSQEFPRLRLGVGRPPGRKEAADYVLEKFAANEQELLLQVLEQASQAAVTFVKEGLNAAMNRSMVRFQRNRSLCLKLSDRQNPTRSCLPG